MNFLEQFHRGKSSQCFDKGEEGDVLDNHIHAMQNTIQHTLTAIVKGQEYLKQIVENTQNERASVELEFAEIQSRYIDTCSALEGLVFNSGLARQHLMSLCERADKQGRTAVPQAIDHALELQVQLGKAEERECQLRSRLDELSQRIGLLTRLSNQVEDVLECFTLTAKTLDDSMGDIISVLEIGELQEALAVRTVEMVEDERRRVAEHLHDGPLQHLASLLMRAESAYQLGSQSMELGVALDLRGRLNDVIGSIRQIVFDLRPPLLDDLGLVPALRWYAAQWSEMTGIETSVTLVGVETLLNHTEKVTLFRVTQEALEQAREHTDTSKVSVSVTYGAGRVMIQVISNGRESLSGDWLQRVEFGQVGLALCRQRILALGGQFSIFSVEPVGTTLNVALPLSRE